MPHESETNKRGRAISSETEETTPTKKTDSKKVRASNNQQTLDRFTTKDRASKMEDKLNQLSDQLLEITQTLKQVVTLNDLDSKLEEKLAEKIQPLATKIHLDLSLQQLKREFKDETDELKGTIHDLKNENDELRRRIEKLEDDSSNYRDDIGSLRFRTTVINERQDDLEQHERLNSIRIYGIPDKQDESSTDSISTTVKLLNTKLGLDIKETDIDIAHRLGKFRVGQKRGIIVKFIRRVHKMAVIQDRKKLKGSGIMIFEDLTNNNRQILNDLIQRDDVQSAWSHNGKVLAKMTNNIIRRFGAQSRR